MVCGHAMEEAPPLASRSVLEASLRIEASAKGDMINTISMQHAAGSKYGYASWCYE